MPQNPTSREIMEKYRRNVIVSCVKKLEPIVLVEGSGAVVRDLDGKEYIDCWSGIAVSNVGHCHPKVVKAAKDQLDRMIHACNYVYHTIPPALLAEKLAEIAPGKGLEKTFFANSGAESVECALKLARKFTKKHEFIALYCSFHGRTIGTLSVTGQAGRRRYDMGPYLSGVSFAPAPYCYRCSLGQTYPQCGLQCARMIEDIITFSTSASVAAFIAEPLLGEGGIIVPPEPYFREVKRILEKNRILFIDDEVQTGFGRTGRIFGIEHYGVEPDIVCMAKGIAGGLPLGACLAKAKIGDAFEPGDHLSTFGGNPVSCAAALANIDVILDERLPERAAKLGSQLMKGLAGVQREREIVGEVRGKGLMVGAELVADPETKEPARDETEGVRHRMRELGVLVGSGGSKGNVIRFQPPLVVSEEQVDRIVEVFEQALRGVKGG